MSMRATLYVAASLLVVSAIPLVVVAFLPRDQRRVRTAVSYLVSFAIGALLGSAFLHLIPESYEQSGNRYVTALAVLGGFLGFFVLERFLWHHGHAAPQRSRAPLPPLAALNLLGDAVHNLMDGMAIAASYMADPAVGLTTTIAVVLHEVPQELGDYGVLLFSGLSVRRAVLYNLGTAAVAFLGAAVVLGAGEHLGDAASFLLPVTAGSFLYIAASDLLPELQRGRSPAVTLQQLATILLGIGVMLLPALTGA